MKRNVVILCSIIYVSQSVVLGQTKEYANFVHRADSLYTIKEFKQSALTYSLAFKANGWKGLSNDRYNAACSWALSGNSDSAFFQLERIVKKSNYSNYKHISSDPDLNSLQSDQRWERLLNLVKQNKEKAEANRNRPLADQLDSIYTEDQKYRLAIPDIEKKYGYDSKEMKDHWKLIQTKDSINQIKVERVLDKYGWLGSDVVGESGSSALFLVIQHADLKAQKKYLPMMREAVKNGKAAGNNLALLEDRVAMRQGRKQIYGSQIQRDPKSGKYYVAPIEDEPNVNARRAAVGLEPLEDYVKHWGIVYKLPAK